VQTFIAQLATETDRAASAAPAFANPCSLGLCGFAMSTFVLSSINAGWFPAGGTNIIVGLTFFFSIKSKLSGEELNAAIFLFPLFLPGLLYWLNSLSMIHSKCLSNSK
jgi:hypothetical protein